MNPEWWALSPLSGLSFLMQNFLEAGAYQANTQQQQTEADGRIQARIRKEPLIIACVIILLENHYSKYITNTNL